MLYDNCIAVSKPPSTTADPPTLSKQFTICDDLVTDGQGDNLPQSHDQEEAAWMDETNHHRGNYGELFFYSHIADRVVSWRGAQEAKHLQDPLFPVFGALLFNK